MQQSWIDVMQHEQQRLAEGSIPETLRSVGELCRRWLIQARRTDDAA